MSGEKWIKQREMPLDREVYYQPDLPYFEQQAIDKEYKDRLWKKWFFGYYMKCKDDGKKMKLIDQYNKLAKQKERQ